MDRDTTWTTLFAAAQRRLEAAAKNKKKLRLKGQQLTDKMSHLRVPGAHPCASGDFSKIVPYKVFLEKSFVTPKLGMAEKKFLHVKCLVYIGLFAHIEVGKFQLIFENSTCSTGEFDEICTIMKIFEKNRKNFFRSEKSTSMRRIRISCPFHEIRAKRARKCVLKQFYTSLQSFRTFPQIFKFVSQDTSFSNFPTFFDCCRFISVPNGSSAGCFFAISKNREMK